MYDIGWGRFEIVEDDMGKKRWDRRKRCDVENVDVDAFIDDVNDVCRKYGMSIGHEDSHGGFVIYALTDESDLEWFSDASVSL